MLHFYPPKALQSLEFYVHRLLVARPGKRILLLSQLSCCYTPALLCTHSQLLSTQPELLTICHLQFHCTLPINPLSSRYGSFIPAARCLPACAWVGLIVCRLTTATWSPKFHLHRSSSVPPCVFDCHPRLDPAASLMATNFLTSSSSVVSTPNNISCLGTGTPSYMESDHPLIAASDPSHSGPMQQGHSCLER